jgi:pseudoazurin
MFRLLFIFISFVFFSSVGFSQTLEIDMLNKLGKEKMLYSVKVAKIDVNKKIIWRSKTKGHNVEFIGMLEGVKKFKSKINKDVEYEFKVPRIYLYQCRSYKAMGMIGLVIVGNDKSNLEKIKRLS